MRKTIIISLIILFAVITAIIILNPKNQIPSETNIMACNSDDDCLIVEELDPKNPCCGTCGSIAISKEAKANRDKWHAENCKGVECPYYDCYDEKLPIPKCINNVCKIKWVERTSAK